MLVALTLLAVGLLGVGQIFAFSSRSASMAKLESAAISLARELQEKALSAELNDIPADFNGVDTDDAETITAPCQEWAQHVADQLGPNGRGRIQVFDHTQDADLLDGMLAVEVRMSWIAAGDTIFVPLRFGVTDVSN
jgi:type II secretory pathway pseudopilin PulG